MRRQQQGTGTLVYSTSPASTRPAAATDQRAGVTSAARGVHDGTVRIWLERKGRNGKPVSIIRGLPLERAALAMLATRLKRCCGSGGAAKDGEIIIQGDHRSRLAAELEQEGFRVKLAGG